MPLYGYARVSTLDQDLAIQRAALRTAGCGVIPGATHEILYRLGMGFVGYPSRSLSM